MDNLKTGDLILFCGHDTGIFSLLSGLIKYGTHSNFTHVGMVLVDPTFIHPALKGTYVWESSWEGTPDPQDNKTKLGVQITPIEQILKCFKGSIAITRKLNCDPKHFSNENLKKVHDVVYGKPYDIHPSDWIEALFKTDIHPQKTDRFWCSALVGYIYTKCGILQPDTDWSIMRPSDFSLDGENLKLCDNSSLENIETRIM